MSTDGRVIIHAQLTQSERSGIRKNYIPDLRPNLKNVLIFLYQLSVKTNTAYFITFPLPDPQCMHGVHASLAWIKKKTFFSTSRILRDEETWYCLSLFLDLDISFPHCPETKMRLTSIWGFIGNLTKLPITTATPFPTFKILMLSFQEKQNSRKLILFAAETRSQ